MNAAEPSDNCPVASTRYIDSASSPLMPTESMTDW
jgi:hypothetical protein